MDLTRQCPICNSIFSPKSNRQRYCKKPITRVCPVCGDLFETICDPDSPTTCNKVECKRKAGKAAQSNLQRKCRVCGKMFTAASARQLDCNRPITKICVV